MDTSAAGKIHARRPKRLENDTVRYFRELEGLLEQGDPEEKALIVSKALEEMRGKEASLASDKNCSHIVERLLENVSQTELRVFLSGCRGFTTHLLSNRYSSHVMERCLDAVGGMLAAEAPWEGLAEEMLLHGFGREGEGDGERGAIEGDEEDEVVAPMTEGDEEEAVTMDPAVGDVVGSVGPAEVPSSALLVLNMCRELTSNWVPAMEDFAGTHGVRALFSVLGGLPVTRQKSAKAKSKDKKREGPAQEQDPLSTRKRVPSQFIDVLQGIVGKFVEASDEIITPMMRSVNACPALQQLIVSLSGSPLCDQVALRFLGLRPEGASLASGSAAAWTSNESLLLNDKIGSRLMEVMLKHVSDELFTRVRKAMFKGRLEALAMHPIANFAVQQYVACVRQASQARSAIQELLPCLQEILAAKKSGVLWRLCQAAAKFKVSQPELLEALISVTTGPSSSKRLVPILIGLDAMVTGGRIDYTGAACVAALCAFDAEAAKPVLNSILSMEPDQMALVAKCGTGSRFVLEAVLNGPDEMSWAKNKLAKRLHGRYVPLALHRVGCFIVDKAYRGAVVKTKADIVAELLEGERSLATSTSGSKLLKLCNAERFKRDRKEWLDSFDRADKKKRMFEELLSASNKKVARPELGEVADKKKRKREQAGQATIEDSQPKKKARPLKLSSDADSLSAQIADAGAAEIVSVLEKQLLDKRKSKREKRSES